MAKKKNGARAGKRKVVDSDDVPETRVVSSAPKMSADEKKKKMERIAHFIAAFEGIKGKMETLRGTYRNMRKACLSEGIDPANIDFGMASKRADSIEIRSQYEEKALVLEVIGMPFQFVMFDTAHGDPIAQAEAEAEHAASNGLAPECRWPPESDEHEAYMKRYHTRQADLVAGADKLSKAEREAAATAH